MKIYLAAPIFSESDRLYNDLLVSKIEEAIPGVDIYVPQRNKAINDKTKFSNTSLEEKVIALLSFL